MESNRRQYPSRPIAGVGGIVISNSRALLIRRGAPPLEGKWSIPGGALKTGETLAEGVARELFEETGLRIRVLELLGAFDRISLDAQGRPLYHFVILDYLCDLDAGESCPGSDAAALAWATEEQLASFSLAKETERVIRKAFSRVKERSSARR